MRRENREVCAGSASLSHHFGLQDGNLLWGRLSLLQRINTHTKLETQESHIQSELSKTSIFASSNRSAWDTFTLLTFAATLAPIAKEVAAGIAAGSRGAQDQICQNLPRHKPAYTPAKRTQTGQFPPWLSHERGAAQKRPTQGCLQHR